MDKMERLAKEAFVLVKNCPYCYKRASNELKELLPKGYIDVMYEYLNANRNKLFAADEITKNISLDLCYTSAVNRLDRLYKENKIVRFRKSELHVYKYGIFD